MERKLILLDRKFMLFFKDSKTNKRHFFKYLYRVTDNRPISYLGLLDEYFYFLNKQDAIDFIKEYN